MAALTDTKTDTDLLSHFICQKFISVLFLSIDLAGPVLSAMRQPPSGVHTGDSANRNSYSF